MRAFNCSPSYEHFRGREEENRKGTLKEVLTLASNTTEQRCGQKKVHLCRKESFKFDHNLSQRPIIRNQRRAGNEKEDHKH
jgi:hypothetical protein